MLIFRSLIKSNACARVSESIPCCSSVQVRHPWVGQYGIDSDVWVIPISERTVEMKKNISRFIKGIDFFIAYPFVNYG